MPLQISFNDGTKRIDYAYDAAGIKCGEKVKDGDEEKQRTYIAGYEFVDGKLSSSSFEEGRIYYLDADEFEIAFYLQDHLGNNRIIFKENPAQITEPLVLQENHYYPFGMTMGSEMNYYDNQDPEDRHKYNSKELVEDCGLDFYDYGARWYDAAIGRFTSVDPLASDYSFQSPYAYATNNPVLLRDILGMGVESTIVGSKNKDGTYTVIGGDAYDGDNGIYVDDGNGGKGQLIGYSATPQSFYFSEKESSPGAGDGEWLGWIDPHDQSGKNFLNSQIVLANPSIESYMKNGIGGQPLDFKRTNGTNNVVFNTPVAFYRGMPILGSKSGKPIFASARDIGNIAAGLVAGRAGLGWANARLGYDALESWQQGAFTQESTSTRYAQKLGHRIGSQMFQKETQGRLPGSGHMLHTKISHDIIEQGGL